jgi:hypothetical protein
MEVSTLVICHFPTILDFKGVVASSCFLQPVKRTTAKVKNARDFVKGLKYFVIDNIIRFVVYCLTVNDKNTGLVSKWHLKNSKILLVMLSIRSSVMDYLKRNNFFLNIFASLSFWIILTPSNDDFTPAAWFFIAGFYESFTQPIFKSLIHFLQIPYVFIVFISGLLLLFSGFKNRHRTMISIWVSIVLLSLLFTPYYSPSWTNFTALKFNAAFIIFNVLALVANLSVLKDERMDRAEMKLRFISLNIKY